ncbi:hypothetical protein BJV74DRAFT_877671 [Russula compacta]|nr:hypothetical protein BJV74DRAFT_877671 [Russula compacta]
MGDEVSDDSASTWFHPFASELDWEVANWVVSESLGHKAFDRFMAIPGVKEKLGLSFNNIRALHKLVDAIPDRAGDWRTTNLSFSDRPSEKHTIRYCNVVDAIKCLWGDPALSKHMVYAPKKIFSDATKVNRIYSEMWTGSWWHVIQKRLHDKGASKATVAPLIITTDKTQLTQFSGSKSAYPVYLTLGNLPKSIRQKPSQHACVLIAYLSVDKISQNKLTQKEQRARNQRLFHESMRIVLAPLKLAGENGVEMTGGDGCVRRVYPILAAYVADYPEQCLISCSKYGTCPKCQCPADQLQDPGPFPSRSQLWTSNIIHEARRTTKTTSQFHSYCMERGVSGSVYSPFWADLPHTNINSAITPDNMAKILLGCLHRVIPRKGIIACCSLLDFIYLAQYTTHDDLTLGYLNDALQTWHVHKSYFIEIDICDNLNIPKFHFLDHYLLSIKLLGSTDNYNTEMFKRLHIDFAKEGWRASNQWEEFPQMVKWLSRMEKMYAFKNYIVWKNEQIAKANPPAEPLSRNAAGNPHQLLSVIEQCHSAPGFSDALKNYLNRLLPDRTSLDVFHTVKFHPPSLEDDEEACDVIKAAPAAKKRPARFDTAVVLYSDAAESTGLEG